MVLTELYRRYQLDYVELLVDDADYLVIVLDDDGYRFCMISHGNRNAIERIFLNMESRNYSFTNSFSHVEPQTAESWLQALAVRPQLTPTVTRPPPHNPRLRSL